MAKKKASQPKSKLKPRPTLVEQDSVASGTSDERIQKLPQSRLVW